MPAQLKTLTVPPSPANPRKRTSSFSQSNTVTSKSPRMTLQRTASFLSLSDYDGDAYISYKSGPTSCSVYAKFQPPTVPYQRSLNHYKEQRDRRKALINRSRPEFTITPPSTKQPIKSVPKLQEPPKQTAGLRTSSPLSPNKTLLPPRASFPRSKPEPDLYRIAIRARMRGSPEGANILRMGPRMAVSILAATRELELLVSTHEVNSSDDWEMSDCSA